MDYDVIIIGGGGAGMSIGPAVVLGREAGRGAAALALR